MELQLEPWIETYTGKKVYFLHPDPETICIEDIAWALSNQCRFSGHTKRHYSVAEHSFHVSHHVPKQYALDGLLHDATEAYLVDIPKPIKQYLKGYAEMEKNLHRAIAVKFGVEEEIPAPVKEIDTRILMNEKSDLLGDKVEWGWSADKIIELPHLITFPDKPRYWFNAFMERFEKLKR